MPIDASIYGQIQQPKPINMLADYADIAQIQGAQQANQLNRLKFDAYQREQDESATLNRLYAGAVNPDGTLDRSRLISGAASGGLGAKIPGLQKTFAESDAAQVKVDTDRFKLAGDRYGLFQKTVGALAQEPNLSKDMVLQAGQSLVSQGLLPKEMYATTANLPDDPVQLRARLTQIFKTQLPPEKMFELFAPKPEKIDNGGQISFRDTNPNSPTYGQATGGAPVAKVQSPESVASVAATIRGQNMTDARARETLQEGKTQIVQSDNGPVLVNKSTGAGTIISGPDGKPLPGVTKPLTEGQSKALLFGTRMQESDKVLKQLASEGTTASVPGSRAPIIGGTISALSSGNQQMLDQAKRDFMTAVLRRESGAAISSGEFETADKQYFPQIGDSAQVIAQKQRNRQLAIKGVLVEVPEKQRASITPPEAPTGKGPAVGLVQDGYRFKGGNPADPKSWEKI